MYIGNSCVVITFILSPLSSYLLILSILMFQIISWTIINHSLQFHLYLSHADLYCSHQFHHCFTFFCDVLSHSMHSHAWSCTAVCSLTLYHIFSSLHWCTPVLTLSITWSVIDACPVPGLWAPSLWVLTSSCDSVCLMKQQIPGELSVLGVVSFLGPWAFGWLVLKWH